ncbi:hypothetical protein KUTeg_018956 [Tegillarca granosa]|uniref:Uncharacterized protein n=1 Tax=Tegillarca granosa TaxID=220873 RepID=A0ABQ9EGB0_TEGGR|nr:hypothetical protein KUTeg_018956 [Tegillarca granosa]
MLLQHFINGMCSILPVETMVPHHYVDSKAVYFVFLHWCMLFLAFGAIVFLCVCFEAHGRCKTSTASDEIASSCHEPEESNTEHEISPNDTASSNDNTIKSTGSDGIAISCYDHDESNPEPEISAGDMAKSYDSTIKSTGSDEIAISCHESKVSNPEPEIFPGDRASFNDSTIKSTGSDKIASTCPMPAESNPEPVISSGDTASSHDSIFTSTGSDEIASSSHEPEESNPELEISPDSTIKSTGFDEISSSCHEPGESYTEHEISPNDTASSNDNTIKSTGSDGIAISCHDHDESNPEPEISPGDTAKSKNSTIKSTGSDEITSSCHEPKESNPEPEISAGDTAKSNDSTIKSTGSDEITSSCHEPKESNPEPEISPGDTASSNDSTIKSTGSDGIAISCHDHDESNPEPEISAGDMAKSNDSTIKSTASDEKASSCHEPEESNTEHEISHNDTASFNDNTIKSTGSYGKAISCHGHDESNPEPEISAGDMAKSYDSTIKSTGSDVIAISCHESKVSNPEPEIVPGDRASFNDSTIKSTGSDKIASSCHIPEESNPEPVISPGDTASSHDSILTSTCSDEKATSSHEPKESNPEPEISPVYIKKQIKKIKAASSPIESRVPDEYVEKKFKSRVQLIRSSNSSYTGDKRKPVACIIPTISIKAKDDNILEDSLSDDLDDFDSSGSECNFYILADVPDSSEEEKEDDDEYSEDNRSDIFPQLDSTHNHGNKDNSTARLNLKFAIVLKEGKGKLVVYRRPKEYTCASLYIPCEYCLSFVNEKLMWQHAISCFFRPASVDTEKNYVRNGRLMLEKFVIREQEEQDQLEMDLNDIIDKMKETTKNPGLKEICKNDKLIREFGLSLTEKLGTKEEQRRKDSDNIRTKMRSVARLLLKLNENKLVPQPLCSYICPREFRNTVRAVKELSREVDSPKLALNLGNYIKQICLLKASLGLEQENGQKRQEAKDFKEHFDAHWGTRVSSVANRSMRLKTMNKKIDIPLTEDLLKCTDYLIKEVAECLKVKSPTYDQYVKLAKLLIVRITLFNKRRIFEVDELRIQDFEKRIKGHDADAFNVVNLCVKMQLIEVRGKSTRGLRKVFVLLTLDMVQGICHLLSTRVYAGVDPSNEYVFGRTTPSPLDGCEAMRDITTNCPGLIKPELIRTRLLRKYLATTCQILDMNKDELQLLADHMGHSLEIHTNIYKLQTSVLERTKVARLLLAMEKGNLNKLRGNSLDKVNLEDLPEPEEDDDNGQDFPELEDLDSELEDDSRKQEVSVNVEDNQNTAAKTKDLEKETKKAKGFHQISERKNVKTDEIEAARKKFKSLNDRSEALICSYLSRLIISERKLPNLLNKLSIIKSKIDSNYVLVNFPSNTCQEIGNMKSFIHKQATPYRHASNEHIPGKCITEKCGISDMCNTEQCCVPDIPQYPDGCNTEQCCVPDIPQYPDECNTEQCCVPYTQSVF